jgi:hypothetical protein
MLKEFRAQHRLRQLIKDWQQYRHIVVSARGREIGAMEEERFRALEGRIASRSRGMADVVPYAMAAEVRRGFESITDLLKKQCSLRQTAADQENDPDGFDRLWHEHFIFLNQLKAVELGAPEGGRGGHRPRAAAVPGGTERRWRLMHRVPFKRIGRLATIIVFLGVLIHLTVFGLGLRYDTAGGHFVVNSQLGLARVMQNIMNFVLQQWLSVVTFFDPLLISYGPIWTSVLFILLALSVGYWMFVRG